MTALQLERRISMGEWAQGRVTLGENVEQDEMHLIVWIMVNYLNLALVVKTWHCQSSFRWLAPWRRRRWPGWEWTTGVFQTSCHWPSVSKLTLKILWRCLCDCQAQRFLCNLEATHKSKEIIFSKSLVLPNNQWIKITIQILNEICTLEPQQAGESGEGWRTSGRRWGGEQFFLYFRVISAFLSILS